MTRDQARPSPGRPAPRSTTDPLQDTSAAAGEVPDPRTSDEAGAESLFATECEAPTAQVPPPEGSTKRPVDAESTAGHSAGASPLPVTERGVADKRVPPPSAQMRTKVTGKVDAELVELVRRAGPGSKAALELEHELKDLGVGVLQKLHTDSMLFRALVKLKIYLPDPPASYRKDMRTLVHLAVYSALPVFMARYVFDGEFDPSKASLKTSFTNACLIAFGKEYRRYIREERKLPGYEPETTEEYQADERQHYAPRPDPSPEIRVINRAETERLLSSGMRPQDVIMFIRTAQGFSQKEIADELGITEATVSNRMRRSRKRIANLDRETGEL
jgi:RNA polymerase sigma factor (sigma-70 family)